jgi:hypothetical protein
LWVFEAYLNKQKHFALATFLHCTSIIAHVIIVICPIQTFKIKSIKTQNIFDRTTILNI